MRQKQNTGDEDQSFIADIYEEYKYLMYATVKKYLADPEPIQDILQDSLLKLMGKTELLETLDKPALVTYIVYTVRNTTFNYLRRQSTETRYLTFDFDCKQREADLDGGARDVENQVLLHDETEEFRKLLLELPEREQELLIRRYYLDQSDQEIASQFKCKAASVRMMLTRARRSVLDHLRKEPMTHENK